MPFHYLAIEGGDFIQYISFPSPQAARVAQDGRRRGKVRPGRLVTTAQAIIPSHGLGCHKCDCGPIVHTCPACQRRMCPGCYSSFHKCEGLTDAR